MNWPVFRASTTLAGMSESCGPIPHNSALLPSPGPEPQILFERAWESVPKNIPTKRSLAACAFLLVYLAAYIGVGFVGASLIEHAWSAIFR